MNIDALEEAVAALTDDQRDYALAFLIGRAPEALTVAVEYALMEFPS